MTFDFILFSGLVIIAIVTLYRLRKRDHPRQNQAHGQSWSNGGHDGGDGSGFGGDCGGGEE